MRSQLDSCSQTEADRARDGLVAKISAGETRTKNSKVIECILGSLLVGAAHEGTASARTFSAALVRKVALGTASTLTPTIDSAAASRRERLKRLTGAMKSISRSLGYQLPGCVTTWTGASIKRYSPIGVEVVGFCALLYPWSALVFSSTRLSLLAASPVTSATPAERWITASSLTVSDG